MRTLFLCGSFFKEDGYSLVLAGLLVWLLVGLLIGEYGIIGFSVLENIDIVECQPEVVIFVGLLCPADGSVHIPVYFTDYGHIVARTPGDFRATVAGLLLP